MWELLGDYGASASYRSASYRSASRRSASCHRPYRDTPDGWQRGVIRAEQRGGLVDRSNKATVEEFTPPHTPVPPSRLTTAPPPTCASKTTCAFASKSTNAALVPLVVPHNAVVPARAMEKIPAMPAFVIEPAAACELATNRLAENPAVSPALTTRRPRRPLGFP